LRIGACERVFNGGKIHWSRNDKCDRVDGPYERDYILESFEALDSRLGIAQLSAEERRGVGEK